MVFTLAEDYLVCLLDIIILSTISDAYTYLEEMIELLVSLKIKKKECVNEKMNLLIKN